MGRQFFIQHGIPYYAYAELELRELKERYPDHIMSNSSNVSEADDGFVYPGTLAEMEDGSFPDPPNLDLANLVNAPPTGEPSPEREPLGQNPYPPSPSPMSDLIDGPEESRPGTSASTGVMAWATEVIPRRAMLDEDEEPGQRIQLYDVHGRRFRDNDLKQPQNWDNIAAVRRGTRVEHDPYSDMTYKEYVEFKCRSMVRSCVHNFWAPGEDWGQAVPACVTIYRVDPEAARDPGSYWATIETQVMDRNAQRLSPRFGILETILRPRVAQPRLAKVERMGVRRVSKGSPPDRPSAASGGSPIPASGGNRNQDARGGVRGQGNGRDPKGVSSRSNPPYNRDAGRRQDYTQDPKYGNYNHYNPQPRRRLNSQGRPPPSATVTAAQAAASAAMQPVAPAVLMPPPLPPPLPPPPPPPPPPAVPAAWPQTSQPVANAAYPPTTYAPAPPPVHTSQPPASPRRAGHKKQHKRRYMQPF